MRSPLSWTVAALVALSTASLLTTGCAGQPEQPEPRPLHGCYYFVQDRVAEQLGLPWGVRLRDRPLQGWPALQQRQNVREATTLTGVDETAAPFGYWVRTAPDSVEIGYPAGGGLVLHLKIDETALRGTARPVGDALPPPAVLPERRDHPVELTWARCPDET
jgi:hypothetical protein